MQIPKDKKLWIEGVEAISERTVLKLLGVRLVDVDDDHIVMTMPITDVARQPLGLLHGGVSMVLAESAASTHAAWGIDLNAVVPVGIEISGSHLRSASEGNVRAVGTVLQRSRDLIVHQVDIYHVETDQLLCRARVTNYYKKVGE